MSEWSARHLESAAGASVGYRPKGQKGHGHHAHTQKTPTQKLEEVTIMHRNEMMINVGLLRRSENGPGLTFVFTQSVPVAKDKIRQI